MQNTLCILPEMFGNMWFLKYVVTESGSIKETLFLPMFMETAANYKLSSL